MNILVTGANGYIGTGVVKNLLDMGCSVIATDFSCENVDSRAKIVPADIFSLENPFDFFEKPEIILHLAWRNGFIHNSDTHLLDLPNHFSFLRKMSENGVKKIVVLGSMHEVGFYEGCVKENTPCNPMSLYGISKNALRNAVEIICVQNNTLFQWIRGFYIVGNTSAGSSIFSKITIAAEEGKTEFPFTTGKNQYDFIDYDEFCNQISNVVINDEVLGIINCCSGEPESLASRVERFILENDFSLKLDYGAFPDRPYDSKAIWGDNSKINKILNLNKK